MQPADGAADVLQQRRLCPVPRPSLAVSPGWPAVRVRSNMTCLIRENTGQSDRSRSRLRQARVDDGKDLGFRDLAVAGNKGCLQAEVSDVISNVGQHFGKLKRASSCVPEVQALQYVPFSVHSVQKGRVNDCGLREREWERGRQGGREGGREGGKEQTHASTHKKLPVSFSVSSLIRRVSRQACLTITLVLMLLARIGLIMTGLGGCCVSFECASLHHLLQLYLCVCGVNPLFVLLSPYVCEGLSLARVHGPVAQR